MKIFLWLSKVFFRIYAWSVKNQPTVPIHYMKPLQKTTFGVFFEVHNFAGKDWGLFANPQLGFFYKDAVREDEIIGFPHFEKASIEDLYDINRYLANKAVELEGFKSKLNQYAVQRHKEIEQPVPEAGGKAE